MFYMDASWFLIKQLEWKEASQKIVQNNLKIDVRELIVMFPDLLPE